MPPSEKTAVAHLGNRNPHIPRVKGGRVVAHEPSDAGASVTEVHWQPDIVAELKRGLAELENIPGREAFLLRVVAQPVNKLETACKHVLETLLAHGAQGFSWVAAEDKKLERALSLLLGAEQAPEGTSRALQLARQEGEGWDEITRGLHGPTALKTKKGVEVIANAAFGTAAQPAAMNYVALTANNTAPANTDTTLEGEITTAGGGLIRKQATYAFTESTGVATLTCTFTANGSDTLPVTVNKFGVFNKATSGGTMGIETKLSSPVTFSAAEDNMTLTETLTIT